MQPKNPIPLAYRHALRWLSWKASYQYYLQERPIGFANAYRVWNRLINVSDVPSNNKIAEETAIHCFDEMQPVPEPVVPFNDFRDGVCEVADRLAERRFTVGGRPNADADTEFWQMSGSELELIFAIYMNNVEVGPAFMAVNHTYAMSRLELYFATCYQAYEENPLEQWECDHDPVA